MSGTYVAPGFSDAADYVRAAAKSCSNHLKQSETFGRWALRNELAEIEEECRENDWDGYGAHAVTQRALYDASQLIESLPADLSEPSLAPEPDGQIAFEWFASPHRILSVSVGDPGVLHYAAKVGPDKVRGTVAFYGEFPQQLAALARRVNPR